MSPNRNELDINLDELKTISAQAKNAKRLEANRKKREEELKQQIELEKAQLEAESIIRTISYKLKQAAGDGKNFCDILELTYDDFRPTSTYQNRYNANNLTTKGRIVWDFLEDKGLKPEFYKSHDGVGIRSWDYIRANW